MDDYTMSLERVLVDEVRRGHRVRRNRRLSAAGGCAIAAAALATVMSSNSDNVAAARTLPILKTKPVDATRFQHRLSSLTAAGADLRQARQFDTAGGRAFIAPTRDGQSICIAVPDPPAGQGNTCASISSAEREGIRIELLSPEKGGRTSELVFLLPVGISDLTVRSGDGGAYQPETIDGILTMRVAADTRVSYRAASSSHSFVVPAQEPQGRWFVDCGDGAGLPVPTKAATTGAARRRFCATAKSDLNQRRKPLSSLIGKDGRPLRPSP